MLLDKLEITGLAIVLVGDFNPSIFQPAWLAKNQLITEDELKAADINMVHKDVALFKINWLEFEVTRERFKLSTTSEAYFETARDMVIGIFTILRHTPVKAMGINNDFHIPLQNIDEIQNFYEKLSPSSNWTSIFPVPIFSGVSIRSERKEGVRGFTSLNIQPSEKIPKGLFILIRDHFEGNEKDAGHMIKVLSENWDICLPTYKQKVETVWESINAKKS